MNNPIFSSKKIKHSHILFFLLLSFLIVAGIIAANAPRIKHFLLRRFGTPQTYLSYVESKYLLSNGKKWEEITKKIMEPFLKEKSSTIKASLSLNHLVLDRLKQYGLSAKNNFPDTTLFFSCEKKGEDTLFQALGRMGDTTIASLDLFHSAETQEFYLSCPQAGNSALALSTAGEDAFSLFFQYMNDFFAIWKKFISSDPSDQSFSLHPYLNAIKEVTKETVPLPVSGSTTHALRLNLRLSLDQILDITETQRAAYPIDLLIHAYVDEKGDILGHEFSLLSEEKTLFSLTGLLLPDKRGGKSGDLTVFLDLDKPITLTLSVSQFGYSEEEGGLTGKINLSFDCLPSINFQIRFAMEQSLPKLILHAYMRGVILLTLEFMSTEFPPDFPAPPDYSEIYHIKELSAFQNSLDFSEIAAKFSAQTGIDPQELAALFSLIFP